MREWTAWGLGLPLLVTLALVLGTSVSFVVGPTTRAEADSVTQSGGTMRDNWDPAESALAPAAVSSAGFGELFATPVGGQVYAQPLVWHGTTLVATESNQVEAIDAASGAIEWSRSFGTPWNTGDIAGCSDISPTSGITGTPVIDPKTGVMYFVAKSYVEGDSGPTQLQMHAVSVATGVEEPDWPVGVRGAALNSPRDVFDPTNLIQRPALLLLDGVVYAAFGSLCDTEPFQGWVAGVSTSAARLTALWSPEVGIAPGLGASIWQSGSGLVSDGPGQILLVTGNGPTPAPGPGHAQPPQGQLGNAVVRLTVEPGGSLSASDFFAPAGAATLNANDLDQGSGGVAALPDSFGTPSHPHLLVQAGKTGVVYVLDRDNLGGEAQGPGGTDAVVQELGGPLDGAGAPTGIGQVFATAAAWPGDGGWFYLPTVSAPGTVNVNGGDLYAFHESVDGSGNPVFTQAGQTGQVLGYGSSSPVVTSSSTNPGSALVWIVDRVSMTTATLEAFDPVAVNGTLRLRWSATLGSVSKFEAPATDGGRIYLGTNDGQLIAFGPLSMTPALAGLPVQFGEVAEGTPVTQDVVLTASRTVTINQVSTTDPDYLPATSTLGLPVTLGAGDQFSVPITYTPRLPGASAASLVLGATDGTVSAVAVVGSGTVPASALVPSLGSVAFGVLAVGGSTTVRTLSFTNRSSGSATVTGVVAPAAPFGLIGVPASGTVIPTGGSITMQVSYTPSSADGSSSDRIGVATDHGLTGVPVTASSGSGPAQFQLDTTRLVVGVTYPASVTRASFTISNLGATNLTITSSVPPASNGFLPVTSLVAGTVVFPGQQLQETASFSPPGVGGFADVWSITGDDGSGAHVVALTGAGIPVGTIDSPAQGGWTDNGSATQVGDTLHLTDATGPLESGSAFWPLPVDSDGLQVTFTATIGGGNGADGMTLTLAEPSAGANAVGGLGGGLGYAGIAGVAVGLDTYPTDLVGIGVGAAGAYPNWVAQTGNTPALRQGSHQVDVTVSGDLVTVSIDGTQVISASVAVPPTVLVGFTGGTGAFTDAHDVSGVTITTDKGVPPSILPEVPLPALLPVSMAGIIGIIGIIVRRSRRTRKAVQ